MNRFRLTILLILVLCAKFEPILAQSNTVLRDGDWYKIGVSQDGVYKISADNLTAYGINVNGIDPSKIRIFGQPSGMLPQPISAARPIDLQEIAIWVEGSQDNNFDPTDYILFYAEGPDRFQLDSVQQEFVYEQHLYSDTAYYFLNINQESGKRIEDQTKISGSYPIISTYNHGYVYELDYFNFLHSGRDWFGEQFDLNLSQLFPTNITDIASGSSIKIRSRVMASSSQSSNFKLTIDGQLIGEQQISSVPQSTYAVKGLINDETFETNYSGQFQLPLTLNYSFEKQDGAGYLDYFVVSALRDLSYAQEPLIFTSLESTTNSISIFSIQQASSELQIWKITDFNNVMNLPYDLNGSALNFTTGTLTLNKFVSFDPAGSLPTPTFVRKVANQNLHAISAIDFVIITYPTFKSAALRLAQERISEGIPTQVVTTNEVYNEFSGGKRDVTAIRDFAKYLFDNAGLKQMLLFGKGTYDNKNILLRHLSFIPIYESRNSLNPLSTYGSDDYLGFLEDDEGEWLESSSGDHTMDIGIGRFPVKSLEEANAVVDKLIDYKQANSFGKWRKDVFFVAEDGDFNIHQRDADRLATLIDTTYTDFNTNKIYIDAYPIEVNPGFKRAPEVNKAILETIEKGVLILNYTGHGNEVQWANTRVFHKNMIDSLTNKNRYPLFVTATCEFGRHDDIQEISGAEDLITKENAGAIGMITTSRPVFSSSNYTLNVAFYNEVFKTNNGQYSSLGDIFKETKNNSSNGVLNRNFSLLGDPSMKLSYPKRYITIDSINGQPLANSDTVKALEEVVIVGSVVNEAGFAIADFDGILNATFFDRATAKQTLGNSGAPFNYVERDNAIFRGDVSVQKGNFTFSFIVPKDIDENPESGKFSFYGLKQQNADDAGGSELSVQVGGIADEPINDNIPPAISLYLGDTTFVENGKINNNTLLLAKLTDESGINISNNQLEHAITYMLDDGEPIVLNDFYRAATDTYKRGWVMVPINDLTPGMHQIILKAYDTHNNPAEKAISFMVTENNELSISELRNYPNPMVDNTSFYARHSVPGDEIEATIEIITGTGQQVYKETRSYFSAPGVIDDWQWDGRNYSGGKLNEGIYIYSIFIRSKSSEITGRRYSRLLITN